MPIVTGATVVYLKNVSMVVLILGQGLWFGDTMEKILINPNQRRCYGIPVCDYSIDKYRDLGLAMDEKLFTPIGMEGTTCDFDSRCLTLEDMESCKRITVYHETYWYL